MILFQMIRTGDRQASSAALQADMRATTVDDPAPRTSLFCEPL